MSTYKVSCFRHVHLGGDQDTLGGSCLLNGLVSPKKSWRKWLRGRCGYLCLDCCLHNLHLDANEEKVEADAQKYAGNDVCDLRASV